MKKILMWATVAIIIMMILAISNGNETEYITHEEFQQINNGMKYNEVIDIIGLSGNLTSESGDPSSDFYSSMYMRKGKSLGSNAQIIFIGGKVYSKGQFGLK